MGLFEKLFGKEKITEPIIGRDYFRLLSGYTPVFRNWDGELYESELIRAAVDARARHVSKLKVEVNGTAKPSLQSKLRLGPNEWQTWSQFLYRLSTILDMRNTAVIVPVMDANGDTTGIYPVLSRKLEVVDFDGEPWLRMEFFNGRRKAIELKRVGIMTKYQYSNNSYNYRYEGRFLRVICPRRRYRSRAHRRHPSHRHIRPIHILRLHHRLRRYRLTHFR